MPQSMDGRSALVVGVANKRSIAWAIAQALDRAGARLALTYQNERVERDVRKLAAELTTPPAAILPLDVQDDAQIDAGVAGAADALEGLDALIHAVAFARAEDLGGRYLDTSREGFITALDISAYSLTALCQRAEEYLASGDGGSVITLSYLAALRAVPGYNVMGIAKAALESMVRMLAWDMGERNVRVNAISAGPVRTLAARGVPGFGDMVDRAARKAPLRREIDVAEVGAAACFLASPAASAITGEVLYVDAGYQAMGT